MIVKFVTESKIDDLVNGPFELFEDGSPDAALWEKLREEIYLHLSNLSHDEEAEGSDDSPGFLLQDDHDNTKTIGLEFNDPSLISREAVSGLCAVLNRTAPAFQMAITVFPEENMEFIILRKDIAYIPKVKTLKRIFS
jgi:hypothetical protein